MSYSIEKGEHKRTITKEGVMIQHGGLQHYTDITFTYDGEYVITRQNHNCTAEEDCPDECDIKITRVEINEIVAFDDDGNDYDLDLSYAEIKELEKELEYAAESDYDDYLG